MPVRGIRGAITVTADMPNQIHEATAELLMEIMRVNEIGDFEDIVSAVFTTTEDLTSTFPAEAARQIGMSQVPLLCALEIPVPGSMRKCVRVLLHVNTETPQSDIVHVYLRDAKKLRPDVTSAQ